MDERFLAERLRRAEEAGNLRALPRGRGSRADFVSNDYLGLVTRGRLAARLNEVPGRPPGSTGSRLLAGNSSFAQTLERSIADFHGVERALLCNSGYAANLCLLSTIPVAGDTLLYDEQVHASIHDGIRLSKARSFPFRHHDLEHLEQRLARTTGAGQTFVVVESLYSMDGDTPPLVELVELAERYDAGVIVDEAHAFGVYGPAGRGRVSEFGLDDRVFARVVTFGKSLGAFGAAILGSEALCDALVNFARPFIYTTALPPVVLESIAAGYALLPELDPEREALARLVESFRRRSEEIPDGVDFAPGVGPIQGVIVGGNARARALSEALAAAGVDARAILAPTIRRGSERVRVSLHSFNREEELDALFDAVRTFAKEK